jgi:hypothetical protein
MAAPGGRLYRIDHIAVLKRAGTGLRSFRLRCLPARGNEQTIIHPWRLVAQARPRSRAAELPATRFDSPILERMGIRDRAMLERVRQAAPLMLDLALEPIRLAKETAARAERIRVTRIGRPIAREDIEIDHDARDPDKPGRRIVRARRADPMHTLLKLGSVSKRQYDAMEALRGSIENSLPALGGAAQSEVHAAPWDRVAVTDQSVAACATIREVMAAVLRQDRLVLAWMAGGGTMSGYVLYAKIQRQRAVKGLRAALDAVATFYFGGDY